MQTVHRALKITSATRIGVNETNIILEGFLKSEAMHGVRYLKFIGDRDSSVYPTLINEVPIWGRDIKKIGCANHATKCYRSSFEKLV